MSVVDLLLLAAAAPVLLCAAYLALLALVSLASRDTLEEAGPPRLRFEIIVPAHDEERGVAATVRSLLALDYPAELRRVLVVADNCSDRTAERARAAGAEVLERVDADRRGKGYALAYAYAVCARRAWADAVVVVDADTLATPNLLRACAAQLAQGAQAVQVDYRVRNPDDSWRTALTSLAFTLFHTVRSLGRERLGLSAGLRGNGMCFRLGLLRTVPHRAFSVVEDVEYGLRLAEAGHRVHYAAEAQVLGEMPTTAPGARTQRIRWEGGRRALARDHAPRLLLHGLLRRDKVRLDLALDLLVPPLSSLGLGALLGVSAALLHSGTGALAGTWPALAAWLGALLLLVAYLGRGWALSGLGRRGLWALAASPAYALWKLTLPLGREAPPTWVRTRRSGER